MAEDTSIKADEIDWWQTDGKRRADHEVHRAMAYDIMNMAQTRGNIRVLSFPGPTWLWEQSTQDMFPQFDLRFHGLERDADIHKKLQRRMLGFPATYSLCRKPQSLQDFARAFDRRRRKIDITYLDWMGTWSREKKEDLHALFRSGLMADDGLLKLTIALRRGRPETTDELRDLAHDLPLMFYDERSRDTYTSNIKVRGIPHWVQNTAEEYDMDLQPSLAAVYYSQGGAPQLQLLFRNQTKS